MGARTAAVDTPLIHECIVLVAVDAIDAQPYAGEVYDFAIPDDHTLWAQGLLVHNCDECARADDGRLLKPGDAIALGPPNPLCAGQDFCRCALVWVLSDDAAALQAVDPNAADGEG